MLCVCACVHVITCLPRTHWGRRKDTVPRTYNRVPRTYSYVAPVPATQCGRNRKAVGAGQRPKLNPNPTTEATGHGRMLSPPQEVDEQLDMYDEQEANLEREVAHRTLKIQVP